MRLKISHTTEYLYDAPVPYSLQRLRLPPIDTPAQKVLSWNIAAAVAPVEAVYNQQHGHRTELVSTETEPHTITTTATD